MEWKRRYRTVSSKSTALAFQQPEFIELTVEPPSSQVRGVAALPPVAELSLGPGMVLRVYAPNHSGE